MVEIVTIKLYKEVVNMSNKDEHRLRELRKSLGYSVDEFARLLGIHRSSLYRYEADNMSDMSTLVLNFFDFFIKIFPQKQKIPGISPRGIR